MEGNSYIDLAIYMYIKHGCFHEFHANDNNHLWQHWLEASLSSTTRAYWRCKMSVQWFCVTVVNLGQVLLMNKADNIMTNVLLW